MHGQHETDPIRLDQQLNDEATHISLSQEIRDEEQKKFKALSLNQITYQVLDQFEFLNIKDKALILEYFKNHSPLLSALELQSIRDIDLEKIQLLIPHFSEKSKSQINIQKNKLNILDLKGRITTRWARNIPHSDKIDLHDSIPSRFIGDPNRLFFRFNIAQPGFISAGVISEKDEGEKLWTSQSPTGVDYLSAHLHFHNPVKNVKSIIIGDYRMRVGQGIILDNSFIGSSLTDPGFLVKSPDFIKPYQSLQENNMLRGVATQIQATQSTNLNIFYSRSKIDANVIEDSGDQLEDQRISSLLQSGLHRSTSELNDRNTLDVQIAGGQVKRNFGSSYIGLSAVNSYQSIQPESVNTPYKVIINEVQNQWHSSIFHQIHYKSTLFFGEIGTDKDFHLATIQGFLKGFGKYADLAVMYRNFSPSFNARYSQVFSASGRSQNEKGISTICNFFINKELRFNLRWDSWQNPWLRYRIDQPSESNELSLRISYTRKRKWTTYAQYSIRNRYQNARLVAENFLVPVSNNNLRVHAELKFHSDWTWRSRVEYHQYSISGNSENGYLVFQDFLFKSVESPISGNFRITYFQTKSYNSRIYAFENDMLYQFSIPAFFGSGTSLYFNIRARLNHHWMIESRYSIVYNGHQNDAYKLPTQYNNELKLQVHFSF
ncbi:MAG: hypothetical protein HOP11_00855 [Saprospiraceae bacterium]|nr:hypothetical protein [Saprospiraceae bacterium]